MRTSWATWVHLVPFLRTAFHSLSSSDSVQKPLDRPLVRELHQRRRQSLLLRPGTVFAISRQRNGRDPSAATRRHSQLVRNGPWKKQGDSTQEHWATNLPVLLLEGIGPLPPSTYDVLAPWGSVSVFVMDHGIGLTRESEDLRRVHLTKQAAYPEGNKVITSPASTDGVMAKYLFTPRAVAQFSLLLARPWHFVPSPFCHKSAYMPSFTTSNDPPPSAASQPANPISMGPSGANYHSRSIPSRLTGCRSTRIDFDGARGFVQYQESVATLV